MDIINKQKAVTYLSATINTSSDVNEIFLSKLILSNINGLHVDSDFQIIEQFTDNLPNKTLYLNFLNRVRVILF
jgi:hypothetical protein